MQPDFAHLVDILPEPTLLVDGDGVVVRANAAAARLSAVGAGGLAGVRFETLVLDEAEHVADFLRLCARSRQFVPGAFRWVGPDGNADNMRCDGTVVVPRSDAQPPVLLLRFRPRAEASDRFTLLSQKIAALSKEIRERRKAEQQRDELLQSERAARLEAERASRMKDEFLATLSHELRTPLHAILGWSQLLRRDSTNADQLRAGLQTIERNARAQSQIIDDLLDMSRIISGNIRLDVQSVRLSTVIEAAADAIRPAAEAKEVRLQLTLDPIAGPVKGDPGRLQQVVWNLLTNAVKFTPRGGRVQIVLERVNSHVEIVVSDTGQGISPDFLPHVFDRFRQQDSTTKRRHGGLGLGLSIVRQLVELHGGTVRAKSLGEGQGASFVIALPLLAIDDADGRSRQAQAHLASTGAERAPPADALPMLSAARVLVVDDEPDARELLRRVLGERGALVSTAASAAEALEQMDIARPQILVCDIGMAGTDGYELMRQIRARPPAAGGMTPAVAVTAFARPEDRTRAMLAGFNGHLAKPVESAELLAMIANFLKLSTSAAD